MRVISLQLKSPLGDIIINDATARKLEIKLNLSDHGHPWYELGDALYAAHTGKTSSGSTRFSMDITGDQFTWIVANM